MAVCEIHNWLHQTCILMLRVSLFPFPMIFTYVCDMVIVNYGLVHISKFIALRFLFWNLFQHLPILYCSVLMLISYSCMIMLITYCSVPIVFTDAAQFNWNGFLNQCFMCYWQRWPSVHLDDEIISFIDVFGLTRTVMGQGPDHMVLSQLYMSARAHIR